MARPQSIPIAPKTNPGTVRPYHGHGVLDLATMRPFALASPSQFSPRSAAFTEES